MAMSRLTSSSRRQPLRRASSPYLEWRHIVGLPKKTGEDSSSITSQFLQKTFEATVASTRLCLRAIETSTITPLSVGRASQLKEMAYVSFLAAQGAYLHALSLEARVRQSTNPTSSPPGESSSDS